MGDLVNLHEMGRTPPARRALARYLRELAEVIEADEAETAPNAAVVILTGRTQHEVLHVGNDEEPGFIRGALLAAQAVHTPHYDTAGGNIRLRTHTYASGRRAADLVTLQKRAPRNGEDG
ncbi:hypothetical protein [Ponticoccus litoralis]|uniref:Uncharacterized protein n=1 Tax=Ponticoccus litoralis TaxID=422297 RepID=A0AAW9SSV6_9RHOB